MLYVFNKKITKKRGTSLLDALLSCRVLSLKSIWSLNSILSWVSWQWGILRRCSKTSREGLKALACLTCLETWTKDQVLMLETWDQTNRNSYVWTQRPGLSLQPSLPWTGRVLIAIFSDADFGSLITSMCKMIDRRLINRFQKVRSKKKDVVWKHWEEMLITIATQSLVGRGAACKKSVWDMSSVLASRRQSCWLALRWTLEGRVLAGDVAVWNRSKGSPCALLAGKGCAVGGDQALPLLIGFEASCTGSAGNAHGRVEIQCLIQRNSFWAMSAAKDIAASNMKWMGIGACKGRMSWVVPEQLRDTIIEIQRQIRVSRQKQMKNEKKLNKKQTYLLQWCRRSKKPNSRRQPGLVQTWVLLSGCGQSNVQYK